MTRALLSPQAQLVLLAAGGAQSEPAMREVLQGPIRWPEVAALAHVERAAPPLWRRLRAMSALPAARRGADALEPVARVWEFKLFRLQGLLHEVLAAFEAAGIEVLLLKGAAIVHTLLPSFAERPMSDLDLLVRPDRAREAWLLAQRLGWRWDAAAYPLAGYAEHHHLPPLIDGGGSDTALEIHSEPLRAHNPFHLSASQLWARARVVRVGSQRAWAPADEHLFLHTCVHFAWTHRMQSKLWRSLRDIGAYFEHGSLGWERMAATAHTAGAERCCYWTLRLARTLARIPVPEPLLDSLAPNQPSWLRRALERHFVLGAVPTADGCPSEALTRAVWHIGIRLGEAGDDDSPAKRMSDVPFATENLGLLGRLQNQFRNAPSWRRYWRALLHAE